MSAKDLNLDATDRAILLELQKNARVSFTDLGGEVGLTSPAVRERIRKMESAGIILGYRTILNPALIGNPIRALVSLKSKHEWPEKYVPRFLDKIPEVLRYWGVTGPTDFFVEIVVTSITRLESLLERMSELGFVSTHIVLNFSGENRPFLPGNQDE